MIAVWTAILLVCEAVVYLRVASEVLGPPGSPLPAVAALALAIYGAVRLVLVLVSFLVARVFRGEPWSPLGFGGWRRCVLNEWAAMMRHHLYVLPFHRILRPWLRGDLWQAGGSDRAADAQGLPPILFLHGLWNNAGVWHPLVEDFRRSGYPRLFSFTYGPPWSGIEQFADAVAVEIEAICARCAAERIVVVAHSMGGLVARAYLRRYGTRRVDRLLTLATPHRGSALAHLAFGLCAQQLRPASEWIRAWESLPPIAVPCVSIYSEHDNLVSPQSSPELPGARWIALRGLGHNAFHYSRAVRRLVLTEVDRATPAATPGAHEAARAATSGSRA